MAKSKGRGGFGRALSGRSVSGRGGTVTVIEDHISRSYARTAKIAFWVISIIVGLLAATVLAGTTLHPLLGHPIVALAAGAVIGAAVALPISAVIIAWPIIRVIWWWAPEITLAAIGVYGFNLLALNTTLPVRLAVVMAIAAPAVVPAVRHAVMKIAYCFISRHRIRTCFAQFIIGSNRASLPFILWARANPVGESIWIWLRPGLSLTDLENRLDQIAVACWASAATVEKASATNAAYLRINIKRRDALTGTVLSPLRDQIDTGIPATERDTLEVPTALDLPDVTAESVTNPASGKSAAKANGNRGDKTPATVAAGTDDDISDWM